MIDHDTDSYQKITRAFLDGQPAGHLTRDRIIDNITLYWLTGTGASAARAYWESGRAAALAAGQAPAEISVPAGFTAFPGEIFQAPRSLAEKAYPTLTYLNEVGRGGHFAAWEEPELFATEDPGGLQVATRREIVMSSTAGTSSEIRSLQVVTAPVWSVVGFPASPPPVSGAIMGA